MLKIIAAGAIGLSLMACAAQAQTSAPVDPQRLALAKQIFEVQGGSQNAALVMKNMEKSMLDAAKTPEAKQRMSSVLETMSNTFLPRLFDEMAGYYAQDFTDDQLKDILAFYKSPTGQKLRANAPVLAQQIGGSMARLMPRLQLSVLDKVCAETECSPSNNSSLGR